MQPLTASFVTPTTCVHQGDYARSKCLLKEAKSTLELGNSRVNGADASATLRPVKDDVARAMSMARPTHPVSDAQWQQLLDSCAWSMAMCTHPMCTPAGESPKSGAFSGDPEGRVRRPGSEFEHPVAHDRHHVA